MDLINSKINFAKLSIWFHPSILCTCTIITLKWLRIVCLISLWIAEYVWQSNQGLYYDVLIISVNIFTYRISSNRRCRLRNSRDLARSSRHFLAWHLINREGHSKFINSQINIELTCEYFRQFLAEGLAHAQCLAPIAYRQIDNQVRVLHIYRSGPWKDDIKSGLMGTLRTVPHW